MATKTSYGNIQVESPLSIDLDKVVFKTNYTLEDFGGNSMAYDLYLQSEKLFDQVEQEMKIGEFAESNDTDQDL